MPVIIALSNQKGGVGKTTVAVNLSQALYREGFKCLLIDLDPQATITRHVSSLDRMAPKTFVDACLSGYPLEYPDNYKDLFIGPTVMEGVDLVRSCREPSEITKLPASVRAELDVMGVEHFVANHIKALGQGYDFVILDTPPAIGISTDSALLASDYLLVPYDVDGNYSGMGLEGILKKLRGAQSGENEKLQLLGVLLTKYKGNTNLSKETKSALMSKGLAMDTTIRASQIIGKSQIKRTSVFALPGAGRIVDDFVDLAVEVLKKVGVPSKKKKSKQFKEAA